MADAAVMRTLVIRHWPILTKRHARFWTLSPASVRCNGFWTIRTWKSFG